MIEKLLNLRELIKTATDEKKSSGNSEHTKFNGVRVYSYDTDGREDSQNPVKTSINIDDNDAVLAISNEIKLLISQPYPPESSIKEAKTRLLSMRVARAEAEANGKTWTPPLNRFDGLTANEIARNAMNMSAAYLEDLLEEYQRVNTESVSEEYITSLKESVLRDPAFSKLTIENITTEYVLYQRYMLKLLQFHYFFLIRDLIDDVARIHNKSMTKSTLANGKRFLDSQRSGRLYHHQSILSITCLKLL